MGLRGWLVAAALLVLCGYGAVLAALYANQRSMIYPAPDRPWPQPPGFQTVRYPTADGLMLGGLYRQAAPGKPTLLFLHGNGDSLSGSLVSTERYAAAGFGLLLVEYRGYAGNPGAPDEAGLYHDGRAARAWLAAQGVPAARQVLIGFSLGTGVATQLAAEQTPAALILIAPYTSLPDVVSYRFRGLVPAALVRDKLDTAAKLQQVRSPILIMHDRDDASIPVQHGERLAALAGQAELLLFSGNGHQLGFAPAAQQAGLTWLARHNLR